MKRTDVIIIGGGQAGLAMSRCLADRGIDHAIIERGRVAERWRSERWDSLRLLSPRWQSRLPSWSYRGPDRDGFMAKSEVIDYLDNYARSFDAPLHTGITVTAVEREPEGYRVQTDAGVWHAANVVIATGYCDRPNVPSMSAAISPDIAQVVTTRYRNPEQLPNGGVLVVGASSTGIQLASEIARSGRSVTLSIGRHIRLPRRYRGIDILSWFEAMGVLSETTSQVWDVAASRRQPSLQLTGSEDHRSLDLNILQEQGVRIVGSMKGASGRSVYFEDDLAASIDHAQAKMYKQLDRVDNFIARLGLETEYSAEDRPQNIRIPETRPVLDLEAEGVSTVLWATGYRREYPWLHVPVLDANGELEHDGGITRQPGLYALGLHFMRRRNSSFIDGVGADAVELTNHIVSRTARRYMAVA
ncbi:MAG: NAD(P)-binding domain-containing protein [Acidobacteria bacterium]|nr:NAD(P)-binding domain-containing protein [Acidobacteriota bacterium]